MIARGAVESEPRVYVRPARIPSFHGLGRITEIQALSKFP